MAYEDITVGRRIIVYLDDGNILGGRVLKKTDEAFTLAEAVGVKEEWVAGISDMVVSKSKEIGTTEIKADNVMRWREFPQKL